ncbi:hypothetical protein BK809_0004750 [Diplodia seriata]|uniref:Uncharacterized protein n=1 Tax=Diplodia seriata TaxID=420778 RepID=A0A1S8B760_9PEZI|nr:hypothetical protein BK809_0004750 [Diplodia seriata]
MPPKPTATNLTPLQISKPHFLAALRRYPALVPPALKPLDQLRYHDIPSALLSSGPSSSLSLAQLEQLVEWKLKHGTYRPTLLALVRSNAAAAVEAASAEAFGMLLRRETAAAAAASDGEGGDGEAKGKGKGKGKGKEKGKEIEALRVLTKALKGVGPATASLVLACREPASTPFFSDEVFRWAVWEEDGKGKGRGWGRKIGYTEKEYAVLVGKVRDVVGRVRGWGLGEGELGEMGEAVAVEKVAWVLGKEGVDCDRVVVEGEDIFDEQVEGKGKKREAEAEGEGGEVEKVGEGTKTQETANKSKKRKVQKAVPVDPPRRQTRSSARKT